LFAACPVDGYPGTSIESVSDSARYFVIRIKDESGIQFFLHFIWKIPVNNVCNTTYIGRATNIGIGFIDRSDSFDFNVALQDFFKFVI
jgi:hypothetical protein